MIATTLAISDAAAWAIPIAAAIVAITSLIITALAYRRSADAQHVENLENEVARQDKRLTVCEEDRKRLQREVERLSLREIELLRMVVNLQEKTA